MINGHLSSLIKAHCNKGFLYHTIIRAVPNMLEGNNRNKNYAGIIGEI